MLLHAGTLFIGTGVVGTLIGLVQMMNNIDDPAAIGPAMAVALLTALYGIVGALGCFVVGGMVHGRETRPSTASDPDGVSAAITSIGTAILLMPALVCFAALLAVFQ